MILSRYCQECKLSSTGECGGKTDEELNQQTPSVINDKTPGIRCSRYVFNDLDETIDEDFDNDEPTDAELNEIEQKESVNKVPQTQTNKKETPAERFDRIVKKRLERTLYELKLLAQFGRLAILRVNIKDGREVRQYEWTHQRADEIKVILQKAVDFVNDELGKYAKN